MIAVDATVLADWAFAKDADRSAAVALAEREPIWITTGLYRFELGNVAWKTLRFAKGWDVNRANGAMEKVAMLIAEVVSELDWERILALALKKQISFYDASYVWLAMDRGCRLYSRDDRLRRKCPKVVSPVPEP